MGDHASALRVYGRLFELGRLDAETVSRYLAAAAEHGATDVVADTFAAVAEYPTADATVVARYVRYFRAYAGRGYVARVECSC